jgi:hypothetical protein
MRYNFLSVTIPLHPNRYNLLISISVALNPVLTTCISANYHSSRKNLQTPYRTHWTSLVKLKKIYALVNTDKILIQCPKEKTLEKY